MKIAHMLQGYIKKGLILTKRQIIEPDVQNIFMVAYSTNRGLRPQNHIFSMN